MAKHVVFDCDGTLINTSFYKYQVYDGIKELLSELGPECKFYVWTARDRQSTHRILKELEIISYFDNIFTADDGHPKPSINGLKALVGDQERHSTCVIGDTSFDIIGAKSFGVLSIGAGWNKDVREGNLREAGADFIATHPSECSKLIRQFLK